MFTFHCLFKIKLIHSLAVVEPHNLMQFKKIPGLLPNGNFEFGPKPSQIKGTKVMDPKAIPNWEISGFVEYIKWGQKQGDMLLVVPE